MWGQLPQACPERSRRGSPVERSSTAFHISAVQLVKKLQNQRVCHPERNQMLTPRGKDSWRPKGRNAPALSLNRSREVKIPILAAQNVARMGHQIHRYCMQLLGFARPDSRGGCPHMFLPSSIGLPYTRPWSSMALATFRKPPMLAPFTRLPGVPYFSAVSKQFLWMAIMILCRRSSTSSRVQLSRALFWAISRPEVATPPAFAAFAGP